jgi:hypothetical protein
MNIFQALKEADRDDWTDASSWLFWTLLGGVMPSWLLLLLLVLFSQPLSLDVFAGAGEFALYSAGILSGTMYVVTKEIRPSSVFRRAVDADSRSWPDRLALHFPSHGPLIAVSVVGIVVSAVVFTVTTLAARFSSLVPTPLINRSFINSLTLVVFLVSALLSFLIVVVDNATMDQREFKRLQQEHVRSLQDEFDGLAEGI